MSKTVDTDMSAIRRALNAYREEHGKAAADQLRRHAAWDVATDADLHRAKVLADSMPRTAKVGEGLALEILAALGQWLEENDGITD